uniref:Galectin n=1 Tax=Meloidogyne javanica TaxID=6303 RepID=A0A915LUQ2_MELJA
MKLLPILLLIICASFMVTMIETATCNNPIIYKNLETPTVLHIEKLGFGGPSATPIRVRIIVRGTPLAQPESFNINFGTSGKMLVDGNVLFHFSPRFDIKQVTRNTWTVDKGWEQEERSGGFPFKVGEQFDVEFIIKNITNASSNAFSTPQTNNILETQILPINYTKIYQKLLNQISNVCISDIQYEELYSYKSKAGLVSWFLPSLLGVGIKQIGLNEIRHCFNLKEQKIDLMGIVKEEFKDENKTDIDNKTLIYLQEQIEIYSSDEFDNALFWPEDITIAEQFLDKYFPQVRKLFKLKYEEMDIGNKPLNNDTIDKVLVELILVSNEINASFRKSNSKSTSVSPYFGILGTPLAQPNYFNIHIAEPSRYINANVLFQLSTRFGEGQVIRNSLITGEGWVREERSGGFPFKVGQPFVLEFIATEDSIDPIPASINLTALGYGKGFAPPKRIIIHATPPKRAAFVIELVEDKVPRRRTGIPFRLISRFPISRIYVDEKYFTYFVRFDLSKITQLHIREDIIVSSITLCK